MLVYWYIPSNAHQIFVKKSFKLFKFDKKRFQTESLSGNGSCYINNTQQTHPRWFTGESPSDPPVIHQWKQVGFANGITGEIPPVNHRGYFNLNSPLKMADFSKSSNRSHNTIYKIDIIPPKKFTANVISMSTFD